MGGAPKPPSVPSADQTAASQHQYGQLAQKENSVSQNTPYGTLTYDVTKNPDGSQKIVANQNLSPQQQALLNNLQSTQNTAGLAAGHTLNGYNPTPDLSTAQGSIMNQNLANYQKALDPWLTSQRNNLDNQLRNQGLVPGTQAYNDQMNQLEMQQGGIMAGFAGNMEPQAFQQAVQQNQLPIANATSLAALGNPASLPQNLINTPQQQAVNYGQIQANTSNAQMQAYNAQVQANSGMMSGLFGIGGDILGAPQSSILGGAMALI
jgi:hypothetical protein